MASNTKVMLQRDASGNGFMLSHESFNKWLQTMTSAPLKGKYRWTTQWFLFFHNKNLFHVGFCLFTKHISLDTNTSIVSVKEEAEESEHDFTCIKRECSKCSKHRQLLLYSWMNNSDFLYKNLTELHSLFVTALEIIQNFYQFQGSCKLSF